MACWSSWSNPRETTPDLTHGAAHREAPRDLLHSRRLRRTAAGAARRTSGVFRHVHEIRPLTGLRFLAALGVVAGETWMVHRELLRRHFPDHVDLWAMVLRQEHVAAGLFFCLSGYVLTHRYLDTLTPGLARRRPEVRRFLTARVARVWPAYLAVLHVMLALLVARRVLTDTPPRPDLETLEYLRQVLLVQVWTEADHVGTSWLPVGWALSALVAASLAFPLLAVLVERIGRVTAASTRLVMAGLLPLPVTVVLTATPQSSGDYLWALLVFSYFLAGMLAATAVAGAPQGVRRRWSALLAATTVLLVAVSAWATFGTDLSGRGLLALVVVPTVAAAASCTGLAARVLGSRLLVAGGRVSYALVLVHAPVIAVHAALLPTYQGRQQPLLLVSTMLIAAAVSLALAAALWSLLEAPVRRSFGPAPRPTAPEANVPARTEVAC